MLTVVSFQIGNSFLDDGCGRLLPHKTVDRIGPAIGLKY
jgi:hypothetical protein